MEGLMTTMEVPRAERRADGPALGVILTAALLLAGGVASAQQQPATPNPLAVPPIDLPQTGGPPATQPAQPAPQPTPQPAPPEDRSAEVPERPVFFDPMLQNAQEGGPDLSGPDEAFRANIENLLTGEGRLSPELVERIQGVPVDVRDEAFESAVGALLPLTPDEIRRLLDRLDASQRAASSFPQGVEPEAEVVVHTVSFDPSRPPPVVYVHAGFVSTISIVDASGQPWPIADYGVGGSFDVPPPGEGGHILRVTPQTRHGQGNLSVRLAELATPLTFRLVSGTPTVHYRFDARVPQFGPNAEMPLIEQGLARAAGDPVLMTILDGVPPPNAEPVEVAGVDETTRAWRIGEQLFLRTSLTLLSPSWEKSVTASDGMRVYALVETPVMLLSDNGLMVRARLRSGTGG